MRLVVWHLAGAVSRKLDVLRSLEPDVAVVPECEAELTTKHADEHMVWSGGVGKGLAVLGFNGHVPRKVRTIGRLEVRTMPVEVDEPGGGTFNMLAVWASNSWNELREREGERPIGPVRHALANHQRWLRTRPLVVAGDFNHNAVWDKALRPDSHSYAVADLATLGLTSAYHRDRGCQQGEEEEPTFYMSRDPERHHHLDYCFVSEHWSVDSVVVHPHRPFCALTADGGVSDHAPLVVELAIK